MGQGQNSGYMWQVNPEVTTRCENDKHNCEINHNYGATSVQAQMKEYDNLLMQNIISRTKHKSL
jgi:hypothetical protein